MLNPPLARRPNAAPLLLIALLAALVPFLAHWPSLPAPAPIPQLPPDTAEVAAQLAQLPLAFEPNVGQLDPTVRFLTRAQGALVHFAPGEVVMQLPTATDERPVHHGLRAPEAAPPATQALPSLVRIVFVGANREAVFAPGNALPGVVNYLLGDDPTQWHTNVSTYRSLTYGQLYPGIDLRYDGDGGQLKGTYVVAPGANPALISWRYSGVEHVKIDQQSGDLLLAVRSAGREATLVEQAPIAWQEHDGRRVPVEVRFQQFREDTVSFALGAYDAQAPLIIDPTIDFSTYLGGTGGDSSNDIAVDGAGNVLVTGSTNSNNFPTANALQSVNAGFSEVFITKLTPNGAALLFSTYLGGTNDDVPGDIAVDSAGNVLVTGETISSNFPTANALQSANAGNSDSFIVKLTPNGAALLFSTYLGGAGEDIGIDIAVDSAGNVLVTGRTRSSNFPIANALQSANAGGFSDVFIAKLTPNGAALLFSTYLGGAGFDDVYGIAVDSAGNVLATGHTDSLNFPTANALQSANAGGPDTFIAKLTPNGAALLFSTYLGGAGEDIGRDIAVDSAGNVLATGHTDSVNFPTANALQSANAGGSDTFIAKLTPNGATLLFSTYLGGAGFDRSFSIVVDGAGDILVTGGTSSSNFPTSNGLQSSLPSHSSGFIVKLNTQPRLALSGTSSVLAVSYCPTAPCPNLSFSFQLVASEAPIQASLAITLPVGLTLAGTPMGGASYDAVRRQVRYTGPVTPGAPVTIAYQASLNAGVPPGTVLITSASATGAAAPATFTLPVAVREDNFSGTLVLIYANGDNNLTDEITRLFKNAAGASPGPNVVVLILADGPNPDDTYLYRLEPSSPPRNCSDIFDDPTCGGTFKEAVNYWKWTTDNTGSSQTLTSFLAAAQLGYPGAAHRVLSLVGHGGGWSPPVLGGQPSGHKGQPGDNPLGGLLWDNHPGTSISTPALGTALRTAQAAVGQSLDLLFLDACDMSMLEVAYEVRDSVRYLLASPGWKWAGFPYDQHLATAASGDGRAIGHAWFANEVSYMRQRNAEPFTYTLLDLSRVEALRTATDALAQALSRANGPLTTADGRERIKQAAASADRYDSNVDGRITVGTGTTDADTYVDLLSFVRQLTAIFATSDPTVAQAANGVAQEIGPVVLATDWKNGFPWVFPQEQWQWAAPGGLSIYAPLHFDDWRRRYYGLIEFTRDGQWGGFLNTYWQNQIPPPNPTCPPACDLPPGLLPEKPTIYLPLIRR